METYGSGVGQSTKHYYDRGLAGKKSKAPRSKKKKKKSKCTREGLASKIAD